MTTLVRIAIALTLSILLSSCGFDINIGDFSSGVKANGIVKTDKRPVNDNFTAISASEGLEVYLVPGDDDSLQMPESFSLEHHEALESFCDNLERVMGIKVEVEQLIQLDLVKCMVSGKEFLAYALETDWEKLPETSKRPDDCCRQ